MITKESITELVEQQIKDSSMFLVQVEVRPGNAIRVYVDRPEGISIDECVEISRYLNATLDRDVEDFSLEVSSPGTGEPFRVKQQYLKNVGRKVQVTMLDGTMLEGMLDRVEDDTITLEVKGEAKEIGLDDIKKTKAVITFN
jgi:ribosome maturation factor RimP